MLVVWPAGYGRSRPPPLGKPERTLYKCYGFVTVLYTVTWPLVPWSGDERSGGPKFTRLAMRFRDYHPLRWAIDSQCPAL
jgi:hypothetical protein